MCNLIENGNMGEQGGRGRLGTNVQKTARPRWQGALLVVCTAITLCTSTASYADDVAAMVREADRYRLQSNAAKVISNVSLYQDGKLDKTREYHVYLR
ncbi:MAG: hypothetical protein ACRCWC_11775, partial [Plesiomonas shigelloides]